MKLASLALLVSRGTSESTTNSVHADFVLLFPDEQKRGIPEAKSPPMKLQGHSAECSGKLVTFQEGSHGPRCNISLLTTTTFSKGLFFLCYIESIFPESSLKHLCCFPQDQ